MTTPTATISMSIALTLFLSAPSLADDSQLRIASCMKKPSTMEEKNCAMAKRVVGRRDREAAGLCSKDRYDKARASLQAAMKRAFAKDVMARAWPWDAPVHLESCGFVGDPKALDIELTLRIPKGGNGLSDEWLHVSGYTLDGVQWNFDDNNFADATMRADASINADTRAAVAKLLAEKVPWWTQQQHPDRPQARYSIDAPTTINYRDFEKAPKDTAYVVRADLANPPTACGKAVIFLGKKLAVLGVEETKPQPCRPVN